MWKCDEFWCDEMQIYCEKQQFWNVGYVAACFYSRHKKIFVYNSVAPLNLEFLFTLGKEPAVPVESEALSKCIKRVIKPTKRVTNNFYNYNFRNKLIDTFTVEHLLSNLNSDSVKPMSCYFPVDGVGVRYFEKHLRPPEKKKINLYTSLRRSLFPRLYHKY